MTAAARQKRRRTRGALGLAVYGVEVGESVLNELERAGLLREHEICDKSLVASALGQIIRTWADKRSLESRVTFIATGRR